MKPASLRLVRLNTDRRMESFLELSLVLIVVQGLTLARVVRAP